MKIIPEEPVFFKNKNGEWTPHWLRTTIDEQPAHVKYPANIKGVTAQMKYLKKHPELNKSVSVHHFTLFPHNQWKCLKCGCSFVSDEKPFECPEALGGCGRTTDFKVLFPSINPDLWKLTKWQDVPVKDLDMLIIYADTYNWVTKSIVFPEEILTKIYTLWIISSYKKERWDAVPFLIFRGMISSGKTRGLDMIRELGYRMMHCSGVTFPAMVRASHLFGAGILIDEIDNKVDHRTENGRAMIDFLKPSYRKGSTYTVCHKEDQDGLKVYKNYGYKAFAGEKGGYDDAIFSRSIDFQMEQDNPEIEELRFIQDDLNMMQTKLLNYRLKTGDPPELPDDFPLKGRYREIYSCIIRTAMHIGIEYDDIISYVMETEIERHDEMRNTDEFQVLNAIDQLSCRQNLDDAPEELQYSNIVEFLQWDEKKRQKLGYIFKKKLILKTKRTKNGTVVLLNDPKNKRKLKSLYRRFKL